MPIVNRFADLAEEITAWRRDLHAHPELGYDTHRTSALVAERLTEFGCDEVVTGIGRTGVVGIIKGRGAGPSIGLRADMDALPILEKTGAAYASTEAGKMHACGHDGHTAMLLGAAKYLAETRNFAGTVVLIFQPAEEGGGGAKAMLDDGLLDRFPVERVFGMHNWPGLPVGSFHICPGPLMASADHFAITVEGLGGHAARPHLGADPVVAGSAIVMGAQSIVGRNVDPLDAAVVSITQFHAGTADNIIPTSVGMRGTVRTLRAEVRDLVEERLGAMVAQVGAAYGVKAELHYERNYPVLVNHEDDATFAADVAAKVVGEANVERAVLPTMGGEDFAFMLQARPGAFIFAGVGEHVANLHNETYDFNDELIPYGCSYWTQLVETALARPA